MSEAVIRSIRVDIVRWVSDDFPGIVEFSFYTRVMELARFVNKLPLVSTDELTAGSALPQPGTLDCLIWDQRIDETGLAYAEIDTSQPWGVASVDGRTRFLVAASQLLPG